MKIISEKDNPLLKRKEIIAELDYDKGPTPSKAQLQLLFAKKFSVEPEKVEISKILSETGMAKGRAWIKIWDEKKVPIYSKAKEKPEKNNG